jgi:hypothetical protein
MIHGAVFAADTVAAAENGNFRKCEIMGGWGRRTNLIPIRRCEWDLDASRGYMICYLRSNTCKHIEHAAAQRSVDREDAGEELRVPARLRVVGSLR